MQASLPVDFNNRQIVMDRKKEQVIFIEDLHDGSIPTKFLAPVMSRIRVYCYYAGSNQLFIRDVPKRLRRAKRKV